MDLHQLLQADYPGITDATVAAMEAAAERHVVRKREYVVRQGHLSRHIYFITDGLLRGVSEQGGREDTLFFAVPGDPFVSVHTLAHDEPAVISLQALEDSEVLAVEIADFRRLLDACPDLERWWSAILLEQVYALERRYVWLSTSSAAERYHTFMQIRRGIVGRIPIKYIAQYLSIAPETLSRIRARR